MCLQCACVLCVLVENVVCRSGPLRMLWCCSILICVPLLSLGPLRWIWTTYAQLALVLSGLLLNGGRVGQYVAQCLGPLSLVDFALSWYSSLASPISSYAHTHASSAPPCPCVQVPVCAPHRFWCARLRCLWWSPVHSVGDVQQSRHVNQGEGRVWGSLVLRATYH